MHRTNGADEATKIRVSPLPYSVLLPSAPASSRISRESEKYCRIAAVNVIIERVLVFTEKLKQSRAIIRAKARALLSFPPVAAV